MSLNFLEKKEALEFRSQRLYGRIKFFKHWNQLDCVFDWNSCLKLLIKCPFAVLRNCRRTSTACFTTAERTCKDTLAATWLPSAPVSLINAHAIAGLLQLRANIGSESQHIHGLLAQLNGWLKQESTKKERINARKTRIDHFSWKCRDKKNPVERCAHKCRTRVHVLV